MQHSRERLKAKLSEIIFEADTPAGKRFDILLFSLIAASVAVVSIESIPYVQVDTVANFV